ncbi:TPA: hypothetical protein ACGO9J_001245 [Streptococcus suis]
MKLATSPCSKIFVSLSLSKPVISFDNRLEAVRLSSLGLAEKTGSRFLLSKEIDVKAKENTSVLYLSFTTNTRKRHRDAGTVYTKRETFDNG